MTTPGQPTPASGPPGGASPAPPAPPAPTPVPAAPAPAGPPAAAPVAAAPPAITPPAPPPAPSTPKPPKPPKAAGSAATGAYLLAVVALILAVAAGAAAAYAVKTAWDVRDAANEAAPTTTVDPIETVDPTVAVTTTPSATATPAPTTPTPTGPEFLPDFVRAQVDVPAPAAGSCNSAYVDIDTLAIGDAAAAGHEFYLTTCGAPLRVFVDRTSGRAVSTTPDPTAAACHERVTGTPTSELQIPAEAGLTFCLLTNRAQANAQNLPQRLAIVSVDSITGTQIRLVVSTYRMS